MKRKSLIRHLESFGYRLVREGGSHTIYTNADGTRKTQIPRHTEINDFLARKICRDLQVPEP